MLLGSTDRHHYVACSFFLRNISSDKDFTKLTATDKKIRTRNQMFRNSGGIRFGGIWTGTILLKQTKSLESRSVPEPSDEFLLFHDLTSLCR